jgi:hypothetical protein
MNVPIRRKIRIQIKAQGGRPGEFTTFTVDGRMLVKDIFALHRPMYQNADGQLSQDGKGWVLTHIPTGRRIMREVTTIKQGLSISKDLMNKGIDWTFTDIGTVDVDLRRRAQEVVQALKGVYGLPEH